MDSMPCLGPELDHNDLRALCDLTAFPYTISNTVLETFVRNSRGLQSSQTQIEATLSKLRAYANGNLKWTRR